MMGKTHIFVGTAAALLLTFPESNSDLVNAIIGGTIGGIICDIDTKSNNFHRDAFDSRILAFTICACMLFVDFIIQGDLITGILSQNIYVTFIGWACFLGLCLAGYMSKHRGITHSIMGLLLFSVSVTMLSRVIILPFIIGYISHVALDILNKQRIRILFPFGKGICLKICYADKIANKVFLSIGIVTTVISIYTILIG